jgi:hypothetical protein
VLKSCGINHVDEAPDEKTRKKIITGLRKALKMLKQSQEKEEKPDKKKKETKSEQPQTTFEASAEFYQELLGDEEFKVILDRFRVSNIEDLPEKEHEDFLVECGRRLDQILG